jgi:hypothetical protein
MILDVAFYMSDDNKRRCAQSDQSHTHIDFGGKKCVQGVQGGAGGARGNMSCNTARKIECTVDPMLQFNPSLQASRAQKHTRNRK